MSVYDEDAFSERVAYAKRCLLSGMKDFTRHFDTCFEMFDGKYVMVRLLQEAETDSFLAARLKGFGTDESRKLYEEIKHLSPREIGKLAKKERQRRIAELPF